MECGIARALSQELFRTVRNGAECSEHTPAQCTQLYRTVLLCQWTPAVCANAAAAAAAAAALTVVPPGVLSLRKEENIP